MRKNRTHLEKSRAIKTDLYGESSQIHKTEIAFAGLWDTMKAKKIEITTNVLSVWEKSIKSPKGRHNRAQRKQGLKAKDSGPSRRPGFGLESETELW
jgi:hypothetical protein